MGIGCDIVHAGADDAETDVAATSSNSDPKEVTSSRPGDVLDVVTAAPLGPKFADCDDNPPRPIRPANIHTTTTCSTSSPEARTCLAAKAAAAGWSSRELEVFL
jgi:hypothetical protein